MGRDLPLSSTRITSYNVCYTKLLRVAVVVMLLVHFYIKSPVARINRVLTQVTAGDLTVNMPRFADDDIGSIASGVGFLIERLAGTVSRRNNFV